MLYKVMDNNFLKFKKKFFFFLTYSRLLTTRRANIQKAFIPVLGPSLSVHHVLSLLHQHHRRWQRPFPSHEEP